jgi:hypothetical protein
VSRDCLAPRSKPPQGECISQVNKAFLQHMLRLLVVALAAGAAGCVVHQKSRGVFPTEHLPPPPSEPGLKGATSQTEAQAGTPERKPLSVPR